MGAHERQVTIQYTEQVESYLSRALAVHVVRLQAPWTASIPVQLCASIALHELRSEEISVMKVESYLSRALAVLVIRLHSRSGAGSSDSFHTGPAVRVYSTACGEV